MSRKKRSFRKRPRSGPKPRRREIEDSSSEEALAPEVNSEPEDDSEFEFCFNEATGRLELSCQKGSFGLVRDLIVGLYDVCDIERDGVRTIEIRNAEAIAERKEKRAPRVFAYGCLAAVLGVIVSAVIGVITVIRWIVHR